MQDRILNAADSPRELEALYRLDPKEFTRDFAEAFSRCPDSLVLRVWHERLFFAEIEAAPAAASGLRAVDIRLTIALALIAGTLAKIPLLVVLGLCVFSISERRPEAPPGLGDLMNTALVSVTLMIDVVALAAILFRLTSYGFTPNRLAVLGANLLAFCHLAGILYHYIRFLRKSGEFSLLEKWIVGYLPAYTVWSLAVVIGFPLVFWFR